MSHPTVRFKRLHAGAQLPAYQSAEAAGMDLHACLDAPMTLQPGDLARVPLGWIMAIPSVFLIVLLLSMTLIGDGLRDALDPASSSGGKA